MITRSLFLAAVFSFLALAQLHQNTTDEPTEEPDVRKLLEYNSTNDNEILISYLAAVSRVPQNMEDVLKRLSESKMSSESSSDHEQYTQDIQKLSNCFRTDFDGSMISGALQVAIDEINANPELLPNHRLNYIFDNTCGDAKTSTQYFMNHWKAGARAFIGPEMNCRTEAHMAASQNLPMISYKCKDQTVSDKSKYNTFTRTVPAETEITKAFVALLREFKWRKFTIIYEELAANNEMLLALRRAINEENNRLEDREPRYVVLNVSTVPVFSEIKSERLVENLIEETKSQTRIYLTFGNVRLFRKILFTMGQKGLMEDQEYLLIYLDTDYNWLNVYHAMNNHFVRNTMIDLSSSWDSHNSSDRNVVKYLRNALAIIPTPVRLDSPRFMEFWRKANEYLTNFGVQKDPIAHNWSIKVNRFACYLYDAVYLYANALHELLLEEPFEDQPRDYDPTRDGAAITKKIIGRKYTSMQGFDMRINEYGDAKGNYTLLTWQRVDPVYTKTDADYYPMDHALDITATFVDDGGSDGRLPTLLFKNQVEWLDGLPKDEPDCGFHGELCNTGSYLYYMLLALLTIMILGGALTSAFYYRNRKFENELHSIWKIDQREVQRMCPPPEPKEPDPNDDIDDILSTTPLAKQSLLLDQSCFADVDDKVAHGVAHFKGSIVFVKDLLYKKPKELTRSLKIEMRVMRQLANPNINTFMGIINTSMKISVIREYCARGSLMDLLHNKDMKLDEVFIVSFIDDLIRGMTYLHESELKVHGNLKSTNCLITSRWMLQVADFGLSTLKEQRDWASHQIFWEDMAWTAPEHLRESDFGAHSYKATQKGDVYSFGVILHEIFIRRGPFCMIRENLLEPHCEAVLRRVANESWRPTFQTKDVHLQATKDMLDTMRACWSELPESRPDFRSGIRIGLKDMFVKQKKSNIMDHMMDLMENYQGTLEKKVFERTKLLREEQDKTQNLLHRMLPTAVAHTLLQGKEVVPESFPSVTIYFSDIVGFTRISGESTPMQVVNFLNQLYTLFDSIIARYNVYKVETIGDAYMVVSGVPEWRSESYHAEQIGTMALHLLHAVRNFAIPHRPDENVQLRIGMHTGSCVAGVVGQTMPRYCLFGDTVNTASRMESNGEPLRIHCSSSTRNILTTIPGFQLSERGSLLIKGKGEMTTYWLEGKEGQNFTEELLPEMSLNATAISTDLFPLLPRSTTVRSTTARGSNWGLNRDSTLSLTLKESSFMKNTPRGSLFGFQDPTAYYSAQNGGMVSVGSSYKELGSVHEEDSGNCTQQSNNSCLSRSTRRPFTRAVTSRHGNGFDNEIALRKRSTSLPDGEVLNIDQLVLANSTAPVSATLSRRNTDSHSLHSNSPTPSQYPSYRDLPMDIQRKRGMALTVWPSRKRSLSVGDNLAHESVQLNSLDDNDRSNLITAQNKPRRTRKRFLSKDRKSVISLQPAFLRDPSPLARMRDASPFRKNRFWSSSQNSTYSDRSRAESMNRLWQRFRNTGSQYTGLDDSEEGSYEMVDEKAPLRNNNPPTPPSVASDVEGVSELLMANHPELMV